MTLELYDKINSIPADEFATKTQLGETNASVAKRELILTAGENISIDRTDPDRPVISAAGGAAVETVAGVNPVSGDIRKDDLRGALEIDKKVDKIDGKALSTNDFTSAYRDKLDSVANQATKNRPDSELLARTNHTGVQLAQTISDFSERSFAEFAGVGYGGTLVRQTSIDFNSPPARTCQFWADSSSTNTPKTGDWLCSQFWGGPNYITQTVVNLAGEMYSRGKNGANAWGPWRSATGASDKYTSPEQTITPAGPLQLPHGLGATPGQFLGRITCKAADAEYAVGDSVIVPIFAVDYAYNYGVSVWADGTNINCRFGSASGSFFVLRKSSATTVGINPASWKFTIEARL